MSPAEASAAFGLLALAAVRELIEEVLR